MLTRPHNTPRVVDHRAVRDVPEPEAPLSPLRLRALRILHAQQGRPLSVKEAGNLFGCPHNAVACVLDGLFSLGLLEFGRPGVRLAVCGVEPIRVSQRGLALLAQED